MAQTDIKKLDSRGPFPEMKLQAVDGSTLTIPEKKEGMWGVLLILRGVW